MADDDPLILLAQAASNPLAAFFQYQGAQVQAEAIRGQSERDYKSNKNRQEMQMLFETSQSQMNTLVQIFNSKRANRPVYTVPQVQPRSWLDEINWKIHQMLHGGA